MRLLVVNWQDRLNPWAGGAETHIHETFGRLAMAGHEVTLLASGWSGAPTRDRLDGMEIHRTGSRYTFGVHAPRYYRTALADRPFDAVIEALNKVPVFAPLWSRFPNVLLVHHLFGRTAFREASVPVAAATWLLERPLAAVYRGIPVQAISQSTADDLHARGLAAGRIRVIHPGVDHDFFSTDPAVPRRTEATFLYLGRLRRYKGVQLLIRAVGKLRDRGTDVRVLIAGKGEYEFALRRLTSQLRVDDRVEFLGYVAEEEKRALFRSVWGNVLPSPREGWGITTLEAGACGTMTVASDSPGLREAVVDGRTGILVPHGDVDALAAALARLAAEPTTAFRMGSAARAFAADHTWERTAGETEAHLREILAASAGSDRR
ncbi:MAG: glycosyltransferase family 4 protein [Gemmatimonadota bacterium]|nr:glycosyltransferase family 4 protein [Gemmatimonadota bacterium]